jgi:hypothetical protein
LGDRYIIVYLPFAIWVIGRTAGRWPGSTRAIVLAGGLLVLAWSVRWTHGHLEPATARFMLAEKALALGATPPEVSADWQWLNYHGSYDEWWAASVRGRRLTNLAEFFPWLGQRAQNARYHITEQTPDPSVRVLAQQPWRDFDGQVHMSYLVDRRPGSR